MRMWVCMETHMGSERLRLAVFCDVDANENTCMDIFKVYEHIFEWPTFRVCFVLEAWHGGRVRRPFESPWHEPSERDSVHRVGSSRVWTRLVHQSTRSSPTRARTLRYRTSVVEVDCVWTWIGARCCVESRLSEPNDVRFGNRTAFWQPARKLVTYCWRLVIVNFRLFTQGGNLAFMWTLEDCYTSDVLTSSQWCDIFLRRESQSGDN